MKPSRIGDLRNRRKFLSKMEKMGYDPELLHNVFKILKDNRAFNRLIGHDDYESLKEIIGIVESQINNGVLPVEIVKSLKAAGLLNYEG